MKVDDPNDEQGAPLDLSEILSRLEQTTPGPWRVGSVEIDRIFVQYPQGLAGPGGERVLIIANAHNPEVEAGEAGGRVAPFEPTPGEPKWNWREDLEFISHAREDQAALIAEVERLGKQAFGLLVRVLAAEDELQICHERLREAERCARLGQVVMRYLPDGRRAFLPMIRTVLVPGSLDQRRQHAISRQWTEWAHPGSISGRVWQMPLDADEVAADMAVWHRVFDGAKAESVIDRMAGWGPQEGT